MFVNTVNPKQESRNLKRWVLLRVSTLFCAEPYLSDHMCLLCRVRVAALSYAVCFWSICRCIIFSIYNKQVIKVHLETDEFNFIVILSFSISVFYHLNKSILEINSCINCLSTVVEATKFIYVINLFIYFIIRWPSGLRRWPSQYRPWIYDCWRGFEPWLGNALSQKLYWMPGVIHGERPQLRSVCPLTWSTAH